LAHAAPGLLDGLLLHALDRAHPAWFVRLAIDACSEEATLFRIAAGAFGITLQGVILYRRQPFHQLDLADFFGGRRFASLDLFPPESWITPASACPMPGEKFLFDHPDL
jgi:hypothetical protein